MDTKEPIVYEPQEGETLGQYLQRYTPKQRQQIYQDETKTEKFCELVVNTKWAAKALNDQIKEKNIERGLENLWKILERLNNYRRLLHFIKMLKPVRRKLLQALDDHAGEMKKISKYCTIGRIMGFTFDSVGTVAGLCLRDSRPTTANWALSIATSFGILGLVSTITEMKMSSSEFDDLIEQIQADQKRLAPIQEWYQQSNELEEAMENIFPFDLTNKIVQEFVNAAEGNKFNPAESLAKLFKATQSLLQKLNASEEERLTENLIRFICSREATELCLSLFLRRQHPIVFDVARMTLQVKFSSWPFYICQSVAALAPSDQTGFSMPILARIGLNTFSIFDGINSLRRSKLWVGESQMRDLKEQLQSELTALVKIANFIELRSKGQLL